MREAALPAKQLSTKRISRVPGNERREREGIFGLIRERQLDYNIKKGSQLDDWDGGKDS